MTRKSKKQTENEQNAAKEKKERESTQKKKDAFLAALERNAGIISYACKAAKISRWFYDTHMAADPVFKKQVEEVKDNTLDRAEAELWKHIQAGDKTMIMFYLNGPGKSRGYGNQPPPSAPADEKRVFVLKVHE